jgi:hypothetical protein
MTARELCQTVSDYPEPVVRAAVEADLRAYPVAEADGDPDFAPLVSFWLTDPGSLELLRPPLPKKTIAAIDQQLKAAVN